MKGTVVNNLIDYNSEQHTDRVSKIRNDPDVDSINLKHSVKVMYEVCKLIQHCYVMLVMLMCYGDENDIGTVTSDILRNILSEPSEKGWFQSAENECISNRLMEFLIEC